MMTFLMVGTAGAGAAHEKTATAPDAGTAGTATQRAGHYLVEAGDCGACHTRPGGEPFAGGLAVRTPFGTVYTPNITPDPETGIGKWSDEDFYRAMHLGRSPEGVPYYPVFPYPFFTKVRIADVLAIKAYLFTLKPVKYTPPKNEMSWPYGHRPLLDIWQDLFFSAGTFQPDPNRSSVYNRGAYLVQGLGHCGACHTPRNILGARKTDLALTGARIDNWFAPDISTDLHSTIRHMSVEDIVTFLKTGAGKPKGTGFGPETAALGPMATVVHQSLSNLSRDDLAAIATYLKQRPAPEAVVQGTPPQTATGAVSEGAKIYTANCSMCHGRHGQGSPPFVPALSGNTVVNLADPTDALNVILKGAPQSPMQRYSPYAIMPAFGRLLTDKEIAAVATYVRSHWGNSAPSVSPDTVTDLRH